MSRHAVSSDEATYIVGWDRPLGEFFYQVYPRGSANPQPTQTGELDDPHVELPHLLTGVPEETQVGIADALIAEASGKADTNTTRTW